MEDVPEDLPPSKRCCMCDAIKPLEEFHRNRWASDGLQNRCKPCNVEVNKRWYREHPEVRELRMDEYARRRKREPAAQVYDYLLEHPCVDCGEADPVVLEFDHLRDKVRSISALVTAKVPWAKIEAEIAKCEVVCANCHRRRTAARGGWFRLVRQQVDEWAARGSNPEPAP
jgi:5-methylcytosine-specific restriction endonuclease McrA